MTRRFPMLAASASVVLVLLAAACGGTGSGAGLYGGATSTPAAVKVAPAAGQGRGRQSALGSVVVNSAGHTLYLFGKDMNGRSACDGQCAAYWPPLLSHGKPVVLPGLKAALVGTTTRADGSRQVTYAGHPLYLYVQDTKPGQTTGEGLQDFGAAWDALTPLGRGSRRTPSG